jgi:hypothetical protein
MKIEVGKKYIVKFRGEDTEWIPMCVDHVGCAWGLIDGVMVYRYPHDPIKKWKPDPGEGYDLFVHGQPNFEVVQKGDQFLSNDGIWHDSHRIDCDPNKERFYRRPKPIEKKLVPFDRGDMEFLRGKIIVRKGVPSNWCECSYFGGKLNSFMINGYTAQYLLNDFTFEDGTPCGKWV